MVNLVVDRIRIKRTLTPDLAPTSLEEGELAVEMASDPMRLWVGVPSALDPSGMRAMFANTAGFLPLIGGTLGGDLNVTGDLSVTSAITAPNLHASIAFQCDGTAQVEGEVTVATGNLTLFTGTGYKPGGGEWEAWSDRRTKLNEAPYRRGLDVVTQLQPVEYRYNGKARTPTERSYIGVTADDVIGFMPEIVHKCPPSLHPEQYLTVDAGPVLWALVNSVKELDAMVRQLRAELDQLASTHGAGS